MGQIIDMHIHTNYSDGEYSPDEIIQMAIDKGITTMAITDHDTLNGIKQVNKDNYPNINIINGIELSSKATKGRMHILGYNIDLNSDVLNNKMSELKDNSFNTVLSTMEQIKKDYGIRFHAEDIKNLFNANHNLGRPDLARLCVKYGYATTVQDAFDKYLIAAHDKIRGQNKGLYYQDCIELIKAAGGIPVLAHPKSLELDKKELLILLKQMIECGLQGIEVYHSTHTKEEMEYYEYLANEYNLLISGGSDYHGPNTKPDIELGTGRNNNIKIHKLSLVDSIKKK